MYESHFGLRHRPFRSTPDAARYYPATTHETALAQLDEALADDGLALLTADTGLGKTLLCQCLLQRLSDTTRCAFLTNSHLPDRTALFQAILYEVGSPFDGKSEHELRLRLTDELLTHCANGGTTLLVVDEAHHLTADLLEELRLLANLANGDARAIKVLLSGLPALHDTLDHHCLDALRQRLAVRTTLAPLAPTEAADYLLHHLRAAHDHPSRLLESDALEILARGTHGVPRLLNQAAHRAFQLAHGAETRSVDAEAALEALAALGLELPEDGETGCFDEEHGQAA